MYFCVIGDIGAFHELIVLWLGDGYQEATSATTSQTEVNWQRTLDPDRSVRFIPCQMSQT